MSHSPLYQTRATIILYPETRRKRLAMVAGMVASTIAIGMLFVFSGLAGSLAMDSSPAVRTGTNADESTDARRALIDTLATASPAQVTDAPTPAQAPKAQSQPQPVQYQVVDVGELGLRLRPEPSTTANPIETLPEGAIVTAIGPSVTRDGRQWRQVHDSEGVEGWIAAEYAREVAANEAREARTGPR